MAISLIIVEPPASWAERATLPPGSMWRSPEKDDPDRESWAIILPNKAGVWYTTETDREEKRWDVSGEPPMLTVTPSINAEYRFSDGRVEGWHGWIAGGELV